MNKKYIFVLLISIIMIIFSGTFIEAEVKQGYSENGYWSYYIEVDNNTNEKEFYFTVVDDINIGKDPNKAGVKSLTIVKHPGDVTDLMVMWSEDIKSNNMLCPVTWRFDLDEKKTTNWHLPLKNTFFYPAAFNDKVFLEDFLIEMLQSIQLTIEVDTYNKNNDMAVFVVEGLGELILPYLNDLGLEELRPVIKEMRD
ncbi:MAG: hypothetical protein KGY44_08905 [Halanaerobiales bacterium]|nr:hypothetical protein [Halanaerobiales bacterium]